MKIKKIMSLVFLLLSIEIFSLSLSPENSYIYMGIYIYIQKIGNMGHLTPSLCFGETWAAEALECLSQFLGRQESGERRHTQVPY